jgi:subtilisin-like proprotein convertase family protein
MKHYAVVLISCAVGLMLAVPSAHAQKQDVDYDLIVRSLDFALSTYAPGRYGPFFNVDKDGNGLTENDHLALLSAVLLDNSPDILPSVVNAIQTGFRVNLLQVRADLVVTVSVVGFSQTIDIYAELYDEDPVLAISVQYLIGGYMTCGDNSTINFLNSFLRDLARYFIEQAGYGSLLGLIDLNSLVNFSPARYYTFGDAGDEPNYLGANGNIDFNWNSTSNLSEYNASSGTFKREQWLSRCHINPPVRIVVNPTGGSADTGDQFTFSVSIAGGTGTIRYQWLRTDSNGKEFPFSFDLVGPDSPVYTIPYVTVLDNARFSVAVSDDVSVYDPNTRLGGRQSWGAYLSVRQVPLQILAQPEGAAVNVGDDYTFQFRVKGGTVAPTYQWTRDGFPVGENSPTLHLTSISGADGGTYRCTAVSGGEVVNSAPALLTVIGAGNVVEFPDPNLNTVIHEALNLDLSKAVYEGDLGRLRSLNGDSRGIQDLTNLGKCGNLQSLSLWNNSIQDITEIGALSNLRTLNLGRNRINDLAPLTGLEAIEVALLWDNAITDITPLIDNPGLGAGDEVGLEGNPLSATVLCEQIPMLLQRGVNVGFDGWCTEGAAEGTMEGEVLPEGEGAPEGAEGAMEGEGGGEGEGEGALEGEGEGVPCDPAQGAVPQGPCDIVVTSPCVPGRIRDGKTTTSALYVANTGAIQDINVTLTITHPDPRQLVAFLQAPSGTQIMLFSHPGRGGENMTNLVLTDEADTLITNGIAPFTSRFRPLMPLNAFDGQEMEGYWTLEVIDTAIGGEGQLVSWGVRINPCEPEPGEGTELPTIQYSSADTNRDWMISLSELLRVVQLFNAGAYHCNYVGEDGYAPGAGDTTSCPPHNLDYNPQDWRISLSEVLRFIQIYNATPTHEYHYDPAAEGSFAPGPPT